MNENEDKNEYGTLMKLVYERLSTEEQGCVFFLVEKLEIHMANGGQQKDSITKRIFQQFFRLHMQYVAYHDDKPFPTRQILALSAEKFYQKALKLYEDLKVCA